MGLKPMSDQDMERALERSGILSSLINGIDWSSVQCITVEWADDTQISEPTIFGEVPQEIPPTKEIIYISIYADPGALPIPRKDGKITGEGVYV